MSGSVKEDLGAGAGTGAPDSWVVSDLDDRMSRLILKKKNSPSSSSSVPEFANTGGSGSPAAAALFSAASSSSSLALSLSTSVSAPSLVGIESNGGVSSNQVDQFLLEALQNPRERLSILRIEQDVQKFILDPTQQQLEFQQLPTSYLRLAAHRVAQHYFLQSMVILDNNLPDGSGSRIIVRKSNECRLPPIRLADIAVNVPQEDSNSGVKLAIKQRPHKRSQIANSGNKHSSTSNHPKSVEERKEEYNRARARIFNSNSGSDDGKSEIEPLVQDTFRQCSVSNRVDDRTISEGHELNLSRSLSDVSSGSSRSGRGRTVEPVGRYKANNKVAIIRDREVDRKDPDYDRNYDRYMQRFDPGLGYNGGPYSIQPMFSPAVNYNTEFPQLGPIYRPRISLEHQPRPLLQHLRGPWPAASTPPGVSYGRPEAMMASFSPDHVSAHAHAHSTSAIYMHPSHYSFPRPGVPFIHPPEHAYQQFTQPQQHHEPTFGVARPR